MEFFSGPAGVREEDAYTEEPEYKATVQVSEPSRGCVATFSNRAFTEHSFLHGWGCASSSSVCASSVNLSNAGKGENGPEQVRDLQYTPCMVPAGFRRLGSNSARSEVNVSHEVHFISAIAGMSCTWILLAHRFYLHERPFSCPIHFCSGGCLSAVHLPLRWGPLPWSLPRHFDLSQASPCTFTWSPSCEFK